MLTTIPALPDGEVRQERYDADNDNDDLNDLAHSAVYAQTLDQVQYENNNKKRDPNSD